ncbi:MAG TPA: FixH family protein [Pyrinomonadaceae bacterium]|nr:FixH family protein [Pyrinomonadaceae bacterium]
MLSRRSSLVALCVWLALAQGCRNEPVSDLTLAHEVSPNPPRVGPVTITLRLTDTAGRQVDGARITLEANMSHAGMVPVFADARETEPGRYQSTMELSMAGDWFILVHVTLKDGRKIDRQFDIKGVVAA